MFGKPEWFRRKTFGFGLVPIVWQGWIYTAAWTGSITLPFLLLLARYQPLEAMAWLGLSTVGLTFDVWHIVWAIREPQRSSRSAAMALAPKGDDQVLYILDGSPGQTVAMRNYYLRAGE
jgi:hypothetical protein